VIAASAGGVEALQGLLCHLPADFPAPILVVLHVPATGGRALPRIMDRAGQLHASTATDGEHMRPGRIYVAPPDRHLLVVGNTVRLSKGPRQNGHRPAADPLFRSAALTAGPRVIGVVLSGTLDDGAAGCAAVERRGGTVAIQEPEESSYEGMPRAAIAATNRAIVLTVRQIADYLDEQSRIPVSVAEQPPDPELERYICLLLHPLPSSGTETAVTCPECGGPLRTEHGDTTSVRYECGLGHSWSPASFAEGHSAAVERALWSATLRLEERQHISEELAQTAERRGHQVAAAAFRKAADEARKSADAIRGLRARAGPAAATDALVDSDAAADAGAVQGPSDAAKRDAAASTPAAGLTGVAERSDIPGATAATSKADDADSTGDGQGTGDG
jgi:two-component system chemotaxis response regulator CheB